MGKYYRDDTLFIAVRIQPEGRDVNLPVYNLKKPVTCSYGKSSEYVEVEGEKWLLPENWPYFCHVWELDLSKVQISL